MWSDFENSAQQFKDRFSRWDSWWRKQDYPKKFYKLLETRPYLQSLPYWLAATAVGVLAVYYAEAFKSFTETSQDLLTGKYPWVLLFFSPLCFMLAWGLVDKFSPAAGGSGIPQVQAAINMDVHQPLRFLDRLTGLKVAVVKIFSSLLCVLGGGPIGREGPTIQIAASVFHMMGTWSKRFWPSSTHQPWIIAGGAAGIAAAFNTPLGGIVFAIEELAPQYFSRFKTVLISAVIIAGMVAQWMWGPYLFFGYPSMDDPGIAFLPWALAVGGICGIAGGYFGKLLFLGIEKISALNKKQRMIYAGSAGVFVALLALIIGPELLGGGDEVVRSLLFNQDEQAGWELIFGRYVATIATYLTGTAGGIFAPSLAIGGTVGSTFSALIDSGNRNLMILLGMAGFLSAVTRAPFTALVLVFEMTDRHSAIFFLMVSSVTANGVAQMFVSQKSFYMQRMEHYTALLSQEAEPPKDPEEPKAEATEEAPSEPVSEETPADDTKQDDDGSAR